MNLLLPMLLSTQLAALAAPVAPLPGTGTAADVTSTLQASGPRFGLAGSRVTLDLSDTHGSARRRFRVVTEAHASGRATVLGRGRMQRDGVTHVTITLPQAAGDRVLSLYVRLSGDRASQSSPALHVIALDPAGDFDGDLILSGDEMGLWWTDPTVPNLSCGGHAPMDLAATASQRIL